MKKIGLFIACCLLSQVASSAVYKCIDEEGNTTYSNIPGPNCKQKKSVQISDKGGSDDSQKQTTFEAELGKYRHVGVTKPKDGQTFYLNSGELDIGVTTSPKLRRGHLIEVHVSGAGVSTPSRARTITVTGVGVGPHTITAKVIDKNGKVIATSKGISIHIQKSTQVLNADTKDIDPNTGLFRADGGSNGGATTKSLTDLNTDNNVGQSFKNNDTLSTQNNKNKTTNNPINVNKPKIPGLRSNF